MRGSRKNQGGIHSVQTKTIRGQMWDVFGPVLLRYAVAYVVEVIVIVAYAYHYVTSLGMVTAMTQEEINAHIQVVGERLLPYSTEIGALAALVTIPFLLRMMKKDRIREKVVTVDKGCPNIKYVYAAIMSVAFSIALNNILLLANIAEYSETYQESVEMLYSPSFPMQLLCLGIIYPVMEELLFRGLVFRRIRAHMPVGYSIVSSAVFFGIYHGNMVQLIYGMIAGLMLGYLCEKFGTMKAPILAHVVINTVAVILTELDAFTWMFKVPVRMVIITIACAFVASSMFVLLRQEKQEVES